MGRTLHYDIYDDRKNYREAEREIRIAQELLIYRFTWTCEWPSLRHLDEHERRQREDESLFKFRHAPIASGFTKVADDEWNAVLITRYVTWLSRRLPTATVTLHDEGDYLTPGYQIRCGGAAELDRDSLAEREKYLVEHNRWHRLNEQGEAIEAFERGETHCAVPADEYADRREIVALGLTLEVLARMTLDEVADAIAFPWTTEGLGAA
ncbi:MAG: hypothetical protein HY903_21855 [Deltaproteobacteria bacterium]|nr:hypothetical protein [Deltaproteobacteria bacterium]